MSEAATLQAFLRAAAATGRAVEHIPPFTAFFNAHDDLRFLNYAVPDAGVAPSAREIGDLRAAFRSRSRLPRVEYVEEFAPRLAPALEDAGMALELRSPLMACTPGELVAAETDVPDLVVAPVETEGLREYHNLQRAAFGNPLLRDDEEPRDFRPSGVGAIVARSGGEAVAAAAWSPVIDGVSEIAGIATAEAWRRRGLAGTMTAAAARILFERGAKMCILTPGDEGAQRVYARAGFRRAATSVYYADPD